MKPDQGGEGGTVTPEPYKGRSEPITDGGEVPLPEVGPGDPMEIFFEVPLPEVGTEEPMEISFEKIDTWMTWRKVTSYHLLGWQQIKEVTKLGPSRWCKFT